MNEFAGVLDEGSRLSDADMDVLLLYMSRDSGAIAYDGKVCVFIPMSQCFIYTM